MEWGIDAPVCGLKGALPMKLSTPWLAILATAAALAADPTGDWYATMTTPGGALRVALHLNRQADGALKATLDSIDQGAMGLAASAAKIDGSAVTVEFQMIKASLKASANEGATELTGEWSQGGAMLPVRFTREKFKIKPAAAVPISAEDRDFILSHLERSRREFYKSLEGVTAAQWKFKPAPDRWSIAECAEHLVTTEDALFGMITNQLLKAPIRDGQRKTRADDQKVEARILDRSQKAKAPEMLIPSGKFTGPETIAPAFNPKRDRTIEFLRTSQEDLRGRVANNMDAYQYFILLSTHTLRHTAQLNEVKADPSYPK